MYIRKNFFSSKVWCICEEDGYVIAEFGRCDKMEKVYDCYFPASSWQWVVQEIGKPIRVYDSYLECLKAVRSIYGCWKD